MAGRKDKNTVDYFPHYCKEGKTIFILQNKFGNDGYATWFRILELLGSSENHYYDCRGENAWQYLEAIMRIDSVKLTNILNTLSDLEAINPELWKHKVIWSENFIKNVQDAYERRKTTCMSYDDLCKHLFNLCEHKLPSNGIYVDINSINVDINTQSKVKYSKEKKRKEEVPNSNFSDSEEIRTEFKKFYDVYRKPGDEKLCYELFCGLSKYERKRLLQVVPTYALENKDDDHFKKNPENYLKEKAFMDSGVKYRKDLQIYFNEETGKYSFYVNSQFKL